MPTDPTSQPQELEAIKGEKFVTLYANAANIETTAWDFNLLFGELKKRGDKFVIEQSVAIRMSPQHAKALAGILINNVKEYEKQVGEIKLPPAPAPETQAQVPAPALSTPKAH